MIAASLVRSIAADSLLDPGEQVFPSELHDIANDAVDAYESKQATIATARAVIKDDRRPLPLRIRKLQILATMMTSRGAE